MSSIPPKPHANSKVEQQQLPHFFPEHTSLPVALTMVIITIFLLPLGVVIVLSSDHVTELSFRYDNVSNYTFRLSPPGVGAVDFMFNGSAYSMGTVTRVNFHLSKSISGPVYLQYRLSNFYQNYRWYGASLDRAQLYGGTARLADRCEPFRWPGEVRNSRVAGYYSPCGAVPWSLFNDSIRLFKASGELICDGSAFDAKGNPTANAGKCKKKGIALSSDVNKIFVPPATNKREGGPMWKADGDPTSADPFLAAGYYYQEPGHKIPSSTDEDFIVWVNAAYMADFSKVYRIIEEDLPSGDYYLDIVELFDTYSMGGRKYAQLVTRSWIGGRNHHLGILMIGVGGVAFIVAVAVVVLRMTALRRPVYA